MLLLFIGAPTWGNGMIFDTSHITTLRPGPRPNSYRLRWRAYESTQSQLLVISTRSTSTHGLYQPCVLRSRDVPSVPCLLPGRLSLNHQPIHLEEVAQRRLPLSPVSAPVHCCHRYLRARTCITCSSFFPFSISSVTFAGSSTRWLSRNASRVRRFAYSRKL